MCGRTYFKQAVRDADFTVLDGRAKFGCRAGGVVGTMNGYDVAEAALEVGESDLRARDAMDLHLQLRFVGLVRRVVRVMASAGSTTEVLLRNLADHSSMSRSGGGIVDSIDGAEGVTE